ncbi:12933_t:CDS:2 [Cetraspora pellucida]|uniref:12933_t:CDS:1 n=1 Tax=Cetraspora pellucida TaxID=1433469 RepID=A0A9N8W656_9GLOM|nr:12933_t:CDS:2 [Cetraspora pellucida]
MNRKIELFIGGNNLEKAPPGNIQEFVKEHNGHTVVTKILIANNGIAAVKEIRSIRKWVYETFGDERAIQFTVMATPEDLNINAEYILMADQYIEVPSGPNNNNFANVELIVDIAERTGVHAVWVGWGHASKNPHLPESLAKSKTKIVFIGPSASTIRFLGDKISSTIVAQTANVPTLDWSGSGITQTELDEYGNVVIPNCVYEDACVKDVENGLSKAKAIGFPVMIKTSKSGEGNYMRKATDPEDFKQAFLQVQSEIPGSPIFITKLAGNARHLEVQILADQYGNVISLFSRDCSVQRRHHKIIEEAPVIIAKHETIEAMEKSAVRLVKLVGYVGAGTVEYLYDKENDFFSFLQLKPRLQVEHPITEMISGVNLPAAQLQIAMGIPLYRIRDIRVLYGLAPHGTSKIDFDFSNPESLQTQRKPAPKGHVIAVRITAENLNSGFMPASGMVHELNFRSNTNVWGYFSVNSAGGLHKFADSQFGHIFAYGENRQQSRKNIIIALKELSIRGDFRTTIEYLIKLLETQTFEENNFTIDWLDMLISNENLTVEQPDKMLAIICGAITKAYIASQESVTRYKCFLEKGQIPSSDILRTTFNIDFIYEGTLYKFIATQFAPYSFMLYLNGSKVQVSIRALSDGGLLVLLDGKSHTCYFRKEAQRIRLIIDGKNCLLEQGNDPTQLCSPSPGKLVRFLVECGSHVNAGDAYAEIEVMKVYIPLIATESGVVRFIKQVNAILEADEIIGILTLDDPNHVRHATPYEGQLPITNPPVIIGDKVHQKYAYVINIITCILDGYDNQTMLQNSIKEMIELSRNPELPYLEFRSILSTLSGRIPIKLDLALQGETDQRNQEFPAKLLKQIIDNYLRDFVAKIDITSFMTLINPLLEVINKYISGIKYRKWNDIIYFLNKYHEVEMLFSDSDKTEEEIILALRDKYKDDLDKVINIVLSHSKCCAKNDLIIYLLDQIKPDNFGQVFKFFSPSLRKLAELQGKFTKSVSLKARELLIHCHLPSYEERYVQMEQILRAAVMESHYGDDGYDYHAPSHDSLKELIDTRFAVSDVLQNFFYHQDVWISLAALEVYVRRAYRVYQLMDFDYYTEQAPYMISWRFLIHSTNLDTATKSPLHATFHNITRVENISDSRYLMPNSSNEPIWIGVMVSCTSNEQVAQNFPRILNIFRQYGCKERNSTDGSFDNILYIALRPGDDPLDDEILKRELQSTIKCHAIELREYKIRRVTVILFRKGQHPGYFTFKEPPNYLEDSTIRHIGPTMAYQLELSRLSNFDIKLCSNGNQIHVYYAIGKKNASDCRFFIRALVRPGRLRNSVHTDYLLSETDRLLNEILDILEIVSSEYKNSDCNHLFINYIPTFVLEPRQIEEAVKSFIERHGRRLWRLRVIDAEVRFKVKDPIQGKQYSLRAIINNFSGYVIKVETYQEVRAEGENLILKSIGKIGSMHLQNAHVPYPTKERLQPRRFKAHLMGTTYVYDFPELFRQAVHTQWSHAIVNCPELKCPPDVLEAKELALDEKGQLQEVVRPAGSNICGMVAWLFTLFTPEYPKGRKIIVIANDITHQIGTFGFVEDQFFTKATELARKLGIPRIYLSANYGARIGLANELMNNFKVSWKNENNPSEGINYLFLDAETYRQLNQSGRKSVIAEKLVENGELELGSLKSPGVTSQAYNDIFTITLVTCCSVGIGAHLIRLGQRTIQNEGQPIILTGASTLNKVLGREVYMSNLQLGGTQIMHRNGISHLTAQNDLEGITKIIQWLSYVPSAHDLPVPILENSDTWDRDIDYIPPKGLYDPRWLLAGKYDSDNWISGFFDRESFVETLGAWAKTVVVGRARLGGIPMGVIAVETRTVEHIIPADPANSESQQETIMEAGQVWYPNSAYKTAQAINDFNKGEQLPLMIFANWRGFSGGQRDMFLEILKYGSYIVDALIDYKQPVFVYIVPNGELRGGAWVVVDPTINESMMEMYADEKAKAGILEPEGIVEIKYRNAQLISTMERLDETYRKLKKSLEDPLKTEVEKTKIEILLKAREQELLPVYSQIALQFAELHDTPGRMKAKNAIRKILEWKNARRFFYWRVKRRLNEEYMFKKLSTINPSFTRNQIKKYLMEWFHNDFGTEFNWEESDFKVAKWFDEMLENFNDNERNEGNDIISIKSTSKKELINLRIKNIKNEMITKKVVDLAKINQQAVIDGISKILGSLALVEKTNILEKLDKTLNN